MEEQLETLAGTVENIVFSNGDTGFTVFELDAAGSLVTVVGTLPGIAVGEDVTLTGRYGSHPTYGHQFRAEIFERRLPATAAAILRYLSSGAIKGIGPRTAQVIVSAFGDKTLEIIENSPERLEDIRGISPKKAKAISEEYKRIFGIRAVMLELARYDIQAAAAIRVWRCWGSQAAEMISGSPYRLCGAEIGVPFEKADEIAGILGFERADPRRIRAGVVHVLEHNLNNGHTCLPVRKLAAAASGLLGTDSAAVEQEIFNAAAENDIVTDSFFGEEYAYLPQMYEAETYIAGRVRMMLGNSPPDPAAPALSSEIDRIGELFGFQYAPLQRRAISEAISHKIFILTGGPGTGKTTALKAILELLEQNGEKVALAAPTGRAAKRMSELTGRDAKTIHRLLEVDFRERGEQIKFKRNEKNPLRQTTVILDEVSMVDTPLMHSLLRALKLSCRLILVGDPDQLPSVGPGNILKDLIDSGVAPTVHLSEIFRQASESLIVSGAHSVVRGEAPDLSSREGDFFFLQRESYEATAQTVVELCSRRLPEAYGFSPLWDIQVVVPSRIGALGTVELNRLLQERLNPAAPGKTEMKQNGLVLRDGDKVMQVKNNYDIVWRRDDGEQGTGVFNGDIGIVEMIDRPSHTILVRFEDRVAEYSFEMAEELEHAWAITVHKSQGSEFKAVVMPLMNYHPKLYYRNILYTGVTRAMRLLIMLGRPETVHRMVANHRKVLRYTNLAGLLAGDESENS